MTYPELKTNRLILRAFKLSDANDVQRLAGDRAIADTTANVPYPYADGIAEEWIATHQNVFEQKKGIIFAIELQATKELVGTIGLMKLSENHQAELGYWIGKPFWNQGYCTEAGFAALDYAFTDLNLIRVYARHLPRNPASGKVMQKLGMAYEGCQKQHAKKWDKFEDLDLYGILKSD